MAQIEAKSWGVGLTVPEGRRVVHLDESALRMLEPGQHRRTPLHPSFHSFKYHFKPESIDVRRPGKVQPANPPRVVQDGVALDVEQFGSSNEDKHIFPAVEQGTKDLDVFMIFDPTTGAFTMYEADSSVILTYDRAASAASRARSKTSPSSQPLTVTPATAPPKLTPAPAPTTAPVSLPTTGGSSAAESSTTPAKRTAAPKPKKAKPKPVPVRPPTPPPVPPPVEPEEGELELEPVLVPEQPATTMDDGGKDSEPGAVDAEPEGILPWDALPTTSHKRTGNTSTFNAADGPDEEVFHFGGELGASSSTREPPRKTQSKSGRSGGIVFPKAAPRGRDPPRAAPPPPVHNPEPDDDDMFEMDEVVLPGMESHSNDLEAEMMKQLQSESSDEEEEEEEEENGFDVEAFQEAMAQEVSEEDSDDDDDDDSSSEEDD